MKSKVKGDKMIRLVELEGPDKNLLLTFLYELERRKMLWSKLESSEDRKRTERVWYGYQNCAQLPSPNQKANVTTNCPSWCFGDHDEYIICGKECSELEECEAEIRGSKQMQNTNGTQTPASTVREENAH